MTPSDMSTTRFGLKSSDRRHLGAVCRVRSGDVHALGGEPGDGADPGAGDAGSRLSPLRRCLPGGGGHRCHASLAASAFIATMWAGGAAITRSPGWQKTGESEFVRDSLGFLDHDSVRHEPCIDIAGHVRGVMRQGCLWCAGRARHQRPELCSCGGGAVRRRRKRPARRALPPLRCPLCGHIRPRAPAKTA